MSAASASASGLDAPRPGHHHPPRRRDPRALRHARRDRRHRPLSRRRVARVLLACDQRRERARQRHQAGGHQAVSKCKTCQQVDHDTCPLAQSCSCCANTIEKMAETITREEELDERARTIVPFSVDEATYVGDENDGCYYQVAEGPDGWYVTVVVDCDTASFVDTLVKDDGPCPTKKHAEETGRNTAVDWCVTNGVSFE